MICSAKIENAVNAVIVYSRARGTGQIVCNGRQSCFVGFALFTKSQFIFILFQPTAFGIEYCYSLQLNLQIITNKKLTKTGAKTKRLGGNITPACRE